MNTDTSATPASGPRRRRHPGRWIAAGLLLLVVLAAVLAICEWRGWPMLRRPAENWASQRLDRQVSFAGISARWRLHLLGGVKLSLDRLEIGPPAWSSLGSTLVANDVDLALHYRDLFAFRKGQPLVVESLQAQDLTLRVQRLPDGRASWQFGPVAGTGRQGFDGVRFEQLKVGRGMAIVDDRLGNLSMVGELRAAGGGPGPAFPGRTRSASAPKPRAATAACR